MGVEYRGVYLEVGDGWVPLVRPLVDFVLDNGGTVHQVKEKFGGLRFYYAAPQGMYSVGPLYEDWQAFETRAMNAEEDSKFICEVCGKPGEIDDTRGWWKTLCPEHTKD